MKTKFYRVVAVIGRKRNVIYETAPFAETDGTADWNAYKEAAAARSKHCSKHCVSLLHNGANIEISLHTK